MFEKKRISEINQLLPGKFFVNRINKRAAIPLSAVYFL
jgi:hypothetical protein